MREVFDSDAVIFEVDGFVAVEVKHGVWQPEWNERALFAACPGAQPVSFIRIQHIDNLPNYVPG